MGPLINHPNVILGLDPKTSCQTDPRVKPEDDRRNMNRRAV